jgi:AraC-like DNA-binding protein
MASSTTAWARTGEPLIWPGGAGHEVRRDSSYWFDCARRTEPPHLVLQLTLCGAGYYRRGRAGTLLTPGMAFLDVIPGPFQYGYPPEGRGPYELVFVGFSGAAADAWHRRIVRSFGHVLNLGLEGQTASLMLALARGRRENADRYLMSAKLYQLLMTLLSELGHRRAADTRMDRALHRIAAGAPDPAFTISALAEEMDCSREHFSRRFRAATGVGPHDYLTQHRLRLAGRMLREGNEKLETIARASGLGSANYFCRLFRRRVGVTPAQFRAQPWLAGP